MPTMVAWIVSHHRLGLAAVALLTLASAGLLVRPGLRKDYRIEAFVARDDQTYRTYRRFMEEFTSNEVAIIAVQTDDALAPESAAITRALLEQVRRLPAVLKAESLAALPGWVLDLLGERLADHRLVVDNLLSRDGRTAAILLQMQGEGEDAADRRRTVARLRRIVAEAEQEHPQARLIIAGPYVTLIDMYSYVDRDLLVFTIAAFVLVALTLWAVFRRAGPMILAVGVALSATLITLGLAIVLGFSTSLTTQMIVILVTVLSVANCVHLAAASEETGEHAAANPHGSPRGQSAETLARMLRPCTAVMATTAAGFAAVCISSISPVRNLGLLMVCGLAVALATSLAGVVRMTGPPAHLRSGRKPRLPQALAQLVLWAERRRRTVVLLFTAAGLLAAAGFGRLHFESDFIKNFRPGSEIRTSYRFIEENLSPVGSLEIVVRAPDGEIIATPRNLRRARGLGDRLVAQHPAIRKAMSLADLTELALAGLPDSPEDLDRRLSFARTVLGPDFERNFLNRQGDAMRINLRASEGLNVGEKLDLAERVRREADGVFAPPLQVEVTGLYFFYAKLVSGLLLDQYRSFGLTVPAVLLLLAVSLASLRTALVALLANLLPIVFCLGAMGWTGVPVNMTTALMLSVTLGIAVDDTVHYLWRYRSELARTGDPRAALAATSASVGRACVFTTVVIAGGFWILMLSQFLPTAYFGGLVGFTMLGTLAADLILLPVLLVRFGVFAASGPPTYRSP